MKRFLPLESDSQVRILGGNFSAAKKGSSSMANFIKVCKTSEVLAGCGKSIDINGKPGAVFNVDGILYAINHTCCHRCRPLGERELGAKTVICPRHGGRED